MKLPINYQKLSSNELKVQIYKQILIYINAALTQFNSYIILVGLFIV